MADEKRISVSFGAFAVDIEGYDDPFSVLSAVISHMKANAPLGERSFGADDLENAELLSSLSQAAAKLEMREDEDPPRLKVRAETAKAGAPLIEDAPLPANEPTPDEQPDAKTANDATPADAADREEGASAPAPTAAPEPEPKPAAADLTARADDASPEDASAENDGDGEAVQPSPDPAPDSPSDPAAEPITDEETAILRRVRYAITHASDADGTAPVKPRAKAKPAPPRSPAEKKAEVVKDIASTLRRIGARPDDAPGEGAAPTRDTAEPTPPKPSGAHAAGDGKGATPPKKRKPLTMQMQIRPKTPPAPQPVAAKLNEAEPAKTSSNSDADGAAPPTTERAPAPKVAAAAKSDAAQAETRSAKADQAPDAPQVLDREKIRERLVKLEQDDEVIDNFLFDDVEPVVTVEAVAPQTPERTKTAAPSAPPQKPAEAASPPQKDRAPSPAATVADAPENEVEEPLLLTPAEAAPLILDKPVQEPLVLTKPVAAAPAPAPEAEPSDRDARPEPPHAAPATQAESAAPSEKGKTKGAEAERGFARLVEARDAAIPALVEASTRPKRRNGGPRLVALSDESQFDKSMSPQDFAAYFGATSLHDMMEATAVYMAMVEGRAHFSRRDVMRAFAQIEAADGYSTEQRLKTFRKLQSSGALTRVDEHDYALSHETRFGYETQLRA